MKQKLSYVLAIQAVVLHLLLGLFSIERADAQTNYRAFVLKQTNFVSAVGHASSLGRHVGLGFNVDGVYGERALLWDNSFSNAMNLPPVGFDSSFATGAFRDEQVGQGFPANGLEHALLWRGSAESVVELHPAGYRWSYATAVHNGSQMGVGDGRALMRKGSPGRVTILRMFTRAFFQRLALYASFN